MTGEPVAASGPGREPIPPGVVSTVRGRWQVPALRAVFAVAAGLAALGLLLGDRGEALASAAVALVGATPLLRVAWLVGRWAHERDGRFVAAGLGLLAIVGLGTTLAALGVG